MILVLCKSTILNPAILETRSVPKPILARNITVFPRGLFISRLSWRLVLEHALTRYLIALAPFPAAMLLWPHLALPISQAPLLMFLFIWLFETRVLSYRSEGARAALMDADAAGRVVDALAARSRKALTRLAAGRGLQAGRLCCVVEQSEMARVPPVTLISVQDEEAPDFLDLDPSERAMLRETLFDADLTERQLYLANHATQVFLRTTSLELRQISGHARLAAMALSAPG